MSTDRAPFRIDAATGSHLVQQLGAIANRLRLGALWRRGGRRFLPLFILIALTAAPAMVLAEPSDSWITMKSKIALIKADDVDANKINIDTVNGTITLHGIVRSNGERRRAEEAVRDIDGVKRVQNLLQVMSKEEHYHALELAKNVEGVRQVASEIQGPNGVGDDELWRESKNTGDTGHSPFGDFWITNETKMRFIADERVPALDVHVDTRDGVVTLFGTVPTEEAKRAAEELTQGIDGVKRVDNALQVVAKEKQEAVAEKDDVIEKRVEQEIDSNASLHKEDIAVKVENGVARLTGNVHSQSDRLAAYLARGVDGVRSVKNDLLVDGSSARN